MQKQIPEMLHKKDALKNFPKFTVHSSKVRVFLLLNLVVEACSLVKKDTLAQVFSSEFCGFFKNT